MPQPRIARCLSERRSRHGDACFSLLENGYLGTNLFAGLFLSHHESEPSKFKSGTFATTGLIFVARHERSRKFGGRDCDGNYFR
jgi:hypothetical protein